MKDNTSRNANEDRMGQGPDRNHSREAADQATRGNVSHNNSSADRSGTSSLDEKSSGMGRRDKGTGLATKDGVTGSDFDGQVTE